MKRRSSRMKIAAILLGVVVVIWILASYYTDWLWFGNMGLQSVFWRVIRARFTAGALFGILAALIAGVNLWVADRSTRDALRVRSSESGEGEAPGEGVLRSQYGCLVIGAVLVFILGSIGARQWPVMLRYLHSQGFGIADPIFGRDVGFYVFTLPFHQFTAYFVLGGLLVSAVACGMIYSAAGAIRLEGKLDVMPKPLAHFSALGGVFMLVVAWIYRLKIYGLLVSTGKVAFGAGYVDVNVQIWAYWFLVLLFLGTSVVFFMNVRPRGTRLPLIGLGLLVGGAIVVGAVPSSLVQKLVVEPSELAREEPYIAYNIEATRQAYGLDRIEEEHFEASDDLTSDDIDANPLTVGNIRIWDERTLIQTYQQVQEIRPYYVFPGVDVDRYTVDGSYRQVMLSARELATDRLPAQARNWVNERLQYTHGYGIALSPVNRVTPEGLPDFLVKDIPPISASGLEIDRPEIYYGERTYAYVVVRTGVEEFDYPKGDENARTTYEGAGGVPVGTFFKRLMFTLRFKDINILLSGYITGDSRIMFQRQIMERVRTILPTSMLFYDSDPYLVLADGRLHWIIDAYTTSHMYPYSTRSGRAGLNYIRNSVKVVVDAYDGTVTFYRVDRTDPLIAAYSEIFPGLFKPLGDMPESLRAHIRYPKDLFRIQVALYRTYHMQDVHVFYNQEDLWEIPNEIYSEQPQLMEPYYIIVKLPGQNREEFLLMVPFTPSRKDNMIGWLAARCDGKEYGDLLVYKLPKDKLIYGPMQIEARVDQQPEISSQLTLWGQRGSEVIRGNLLAIPIERSFLYVEPVYLQARQESEEDRYPPAEGEAPPEQRRRAPPRSTRQSTAIPELKKVIASFGGQVVMRNTLQDALMALFGRRPDMAALPAETMAPGKASAPPPLSPVAVDLAEAAEVHYRNVRESMQQWNWERAGKEMKALESTIAELKKVLRKE